MRILKGDKYNSILHNARREFIRCGYKDASMRTISKESQVRLSNIYNYFRNKDEIFMAVVQPAREKLFRFITERHAEKNIDFKKVSIFGHEEEVLEEYISLIYKYKEEFRLLLYHSQGSSMDNFRDALTGHMTQVSHDYMKLEKKYYPDVHPISHFFIHAMSSWMVSILSEIVTHDLSKQKIREFFREYFRYGYAGWCELTGIKWEAG
jgi:AcrR family transcriptional regulator